MHTSLVNDGSAKLLLHELPAAVELREEKAVRATIKPEIRRATTRKRKLVMIHLEKTTLSR
jgi:hypothetical protein